MKDVVYMSAAAWADIPASTLIRSWHKFLLSSEESIDVGDGNSNIESESCETIAHQLDENLTNEDISTWLNDDSFDPRYQLLTDEEIINQVTFDQESEEEDDVIDIHCYCQ
jgi:hypothetical protein